MREAMFRFIVSRLTRIVSLRRARSKMRSLSIACRQSRIDESTLAYTFAYSLNFLMKFTRLVIRI